MGRQESVSEEDECEVADHSFGICTCRTIEQTRVFLQNGFEQEDEKWTLMHSRRLKFEYEVRAVEERLKIK